MVLALLGVGAYVILRKVYRRRKATRIEGATIVITGGSQVPPSHFYQHNSHHHGIHRH